MSQSLKGVHVVDLTRLLPGPACSWYLKGLGATVTKVEDPEGGDWLRHVGPFMPDGTGAWFSALNAGSRSLALNLRDPVDRQLLEFQLSKADVLLEGFKPGTLAKLGLDPKELLERYPRLVVASISGFGQVGPYRDLPAHDLNYLGFSGALTLGVDAGGVPRPLPLQVADLAGGALTGALAVAAALFDRERTGRGVWLDVSMTWGALALMAPQLAEVFGANQLEEGILLGNATCYRVYRCLDDLLIAVAPLEPKFQMAFAEMVGQALPEEHSEAEALFARFPREYWCKLLSGACVTPVLSPHEVLRDRHHHAVGAVRQCGEAFRVSPPFPGEHAWLAEPAPSLGEHTADLRAAFSAGR
jgi:alpha-methylacyl-CoA racemase